MRVEAYEELEQRLVALVRSGGPLRVALAQLAHRMIESRAWERLYARLCDYADERIGRSERSLRDLAGVGRRVAALPRLRNALARSELGWTKVRLLARVATAADEEGWIKYARSVTCEVLERDVRGFAKESVEAGAVAGDEGTLEWCELPCTPEVRFRWHEAMQVARRLNGGRLTASLCVEMISAEVVSALPLDSEAAVVASPLCFAGGTTAEAAACAEGGTVGHDVAEANTPGGSERQDPPSGAAPAGPSETGEPDPLPDAIAPLVGELDTADAAELDRRLRAAVAMEQRLDARIGPLLELLRQGRADRRLGYPSWETYLRERLGLDPSWGRGLLRIERVARASPRFARAYREGELSALQAQALAPLVLAELDEGWLPAWVERARDFSLRRLRDDVDKALATRDTDGAAWLATGGLPSGDETNAEPASGEREIRAGSPVGDEAGEAARETCSLRFGLGPDVAQLFRAVLGTVRRRLGRETGCLPTRGQAFSAMLDHALAEWGAEAKVPRRYAIFARDGWRCTAPGCTSMRNLHDHHISFRAAGGSNEIENRLTLCVFHHLRGVHAGLLRITGRAPDRLRFAFAMRPDASPVAVYGSGDRLLASA